MTRQSFSMQAPVTTSVRRAPTGLWVTTSHLRPKPAASGREPPSIEAPTSEERTALSLTANHSVPLRAPLLDAWQHVSAAREWNERLLADVLIVLIASVPEPQEKPPQELSIPRAPAPVVATAAHPRAYRGTTYKPPKPESVPAMDLRGALCDRAQAALVLNELWSHCAKAAKHLHASGLDPAGIERLLASPHPPREPFFAYRDMNLPARFLVEPSFYAHAVYPLGSAGWPIFRRAAGLWQQLGCGDQPTLATLATRLWTVAGTTANDWLQAAAALPQARRLHFLAHVLWADVARVSPLLYAEVFAQLALVEPEDVQDRWHEQTLQALKLGHSARYVAGGITLARAYHPSASFGAIVDCPMYDDALHAVLETIEPPSEEPWLVVHLWRACGAVPGLSDLLRDVQWGTLRGDVRDALVRFCAALAWKDDGAPSRAFARDALQVVRQLHAALEVADARYVPQLGNDLSEIFGYLDENKERGRRASLALVVLSRINRPPFNDDGNLAMSLLQLVRLPEELREKTLQASEAVFLKLDKATRRKNDATLIAWGLSSLRDGDPALLTAGFLRATGRLLSTAKVLGSFSWEARRDLMRAVTQSPLFRDCESLAPRELANLLLAELGPSNTIVPSAVRQWLANTRELSDGQVERHHKAMRERLVEARLYAIEAAAVAKLGKLVGTKQLAPGIKEALLLLQDADRNRRGLLRALRAYVTGNTDYVREHPRTLGWVRRHPKIDVRVLQQGIEGTGSNGLRLTIEQDPLEILKLGTYVGSCLGKGGGLAYSAAAALLDINKQVVYARDARGVVVARQLIAISDDDKLIPFGVYPESRSDLSAAFRAFDLALSRALGIELHTTYDGYAIENVLSTWFWDDGVWVE